MNRCGTNAPRPARPRTPTRRRDHPAAQRPHPRYRSRPDIHGVGGLVDIEILNAHADRAIGGFCLVQPAKSEPWQVSVLTTDMVSCCRSAQDCRRTRCVHVVGEDPERPGGHPDMGGRRAAARRVQRLSDTDQCDNVARADSRREHHGPFGAVHTEPEHLRTFVTMINTSTLCAESAIWPSRFGRALDSVFPVRLTNGELLCRFAHKHA